MARSPDTGADPALRPVHEYLSIAALIRARPPDVVLRSAQLVAGVDNSGVHDARACSAAARPCNLTVHGTPAARHS